ncbi:hypothetical protein CCR75_000303 [Bremia lactucae]|uniref:Uncharacterized protein n=1 Tax=Bremia lactucae TaxID=4779 RepID=A0A976FL47_BRELC|nr:hypothetical protein CCR75_000303 [Bremia lactucae]
MGEELRVSQQANQFGQQDAVCLGNTEGQVGQEGMPTRSPASIFKWINRDAGNRASDKQEISRDALLLGTNRMDIPFEQDILPIVLSDNKVIPMDDERKAKWRRGVIGNILGW